MLFFLLLKLYDTPVSELAGGQMGQGPWSDEINKVAADEVNRLVNNAYVMAKDLLTKNRDLLNALAEQLMDQETVSAEEIQLLIAKHGKYMSPYEIYGDGYGESALPFQGIEVEPMVAQGGTFAPIA